MPHEGLPKQRFPYVLLKGYWFLEMGFCPGDQVTITSPEDGVLVMRVTKTYQEFERLRAVLHRSLHELEKTMTAA
jgi:hypothetical protein